MSTRFHDNFSNRALRNLYSRDIGFEMNRNVLNIALHKEC